MYVAVVGAEGRWFDGRFMSKQRLRVGCGSGLLDVIQPWLQRRVLPYSYCLFFSLLTIAQAPAMLALSHGNSEGAYDVA